ncbi:MAG: hypothetical protein AAFP97_02650 [Pseudomonadota bacterium]
MSSPATAQESCNACSDLDAQFEDTATQTRNAQLRLNEAEAKIAQAQTSLQQAENARARTFALFERFSVPGVRRTGCDIEISRGQARSQARYLLNRDPIKFADRNNPAAVEGTAQANFSRCQTGPTGIHKCKPPQRTATPAQNQAYNRCRSGGPSNVPHGFEHMRILFEADDQQRMIAKHYTLTDTSGSGGDGAGGRITSENLPYPYKTVLVTPPRYINADPLKRRGRVQRWTGETYAMREYNRLTEQLGADEATIAERQQVLAVAQQQKDEAIKTLNLLSDKSAALESQREYCSSPDWQDYQRRNCRAETEDDIDFATELARLDRALSSCPIEGENYQVDKICFSNPEKALKASAERAEELTRLNRALEACKFRFETKILVCATAAER